MKKYRYYILLSLLMILVFALFLTACGKTADKAEVKQTEEVQEEKNGPKNPDVLTIAHFYDVVTLDPHGIQTTGTNLVKVNIFENLVKQEEDGSIVPELAESWEQVDDITYIFNLRDDVKFSNGETMTAEDVVYSLARSASSPTTSAIAGMIDHENCKALDEYTVEMKTLQPFAPILSHLAQECIAIVSQKVTAANNDEVDTDPCGTGPYMISEWVTGDHLTLVENPHYWGDAPKIPTLLFRIIQEGSTRTLELEAGSVDIVLDLPSNDVSRVDDNNNLILDIKSNFYNYHIYLNQLNEYLADENIRKAISCALDRENIVKVASEGNRIPLYGYICSSVWGYNDEIEKYEYDLERAKAYMEAAGYPDGGISIKLATINGQEYITASEIIQQNLADIGITLEVQTFDSPGLVEVMYSYDFDMAISTWVAVAGDPDYGLYPVFHSTMSTSGNMSQVNDSKVDQLLEAGRYESDVEKRKAIYAELQAYLAENAYDLPLWEDVNINAYQSYVKGFVNDANKFYHFNTVYFD